MCYFTGVNGTNAQINRDHVHKWTLFEMLLPPGITVCISFFPSFLVYLNRTQWGGNIKLKISSKYQNNINKKVPENCWILLSLQKEVPSNVL